MELQKFKLAPLIFETLMTFMTEKLHDRRSQKTENGQKSRQSFWLLATNIRVLLTGLITQKSCQDISHATCNWLTTMPVAATKSNGPPY